MEDGGVVLMDLLWSDPTTNDGVEGVQPSPRGPGLVTFGPDRVKEFCKVCMLVCALLCCHVLCGSLLLLHEISMSYIDTVDTLNNGPFLGALSCPACNHT